MSKAEESCQQWYEIYCNSPAGNSVNLKTVWMKAWNARGKVDAEIAKENEDKAYDCLCGMIIRENIEEQDVTDA